MQDLQTYQALKNTIIDKVSEEGIVEMIFSYSGFEEDLYEEFYNILSMYYMYRQTILINRLDFSIYKPDLQHIFDEWKFYSIYDFIVIYENGQLYDFIHR